MENSLEKNQSSDVPMIEQYKVEGMMVHASKIVKICVTCLIVAFVSIVAIVWIFTSKYNERNQNWLEVYNRLLENRSTVTEVQHEPTEKIQQLPPA